MEYMIHMTAFKQGRRIVSVKYKSKTLPPELQAEIDKQSDEILDAEERRAKEDFNNSCKDIVEYLNAKTGKAFRSNNEKTKKLIRARFNQGYKLADFLTVIDKKLNEWQGTEFEKHLNPETLFGSKFEKYLNQPDVKPKIKPGTISRKPSYDLDKIKADIMNNTEI